MNFSLSGCLFSSRALKYCFDHCTQLTISPQIASFASVTLDSSRADFNVTEPNSDFHWTNPQSQPEGRTSVQKGDQKHAHFCAQRMHTAGWPALKRQSNPLFVHTLPCLLKCSYKMDNRQHVDELEEIQHTRVVNGLVVYFVARCTQTSSCHLFSDCSRAQNKKLPKDT